MCSKTVVDFTKLSDDEVKNYFLSKRGERTCGKFLNHQLTQPDLSIDSLLQQQIPLWKKFLAAVLILFGSFLSGCNERTKGKTNVVGQMEMTDVKDTTDAHIILGDIKPKTEVGEPGICTTTKGDVAPEIIEEVIFGQTVGMVGPPEMVEPIKEPVVELLGAPEVLDSAKDIIEIKKDCPPPTKKDTLYYQP